MRRALEEFLRVMEEFEELKLEEAPSIPVSDDCQVMATNCYVKPSNVNGQHHAWSAITITSPWHIPLKRLPLT